MSFLPKNRLTALLAKVQWPERFKPGKRAYAIMGGTFLLYLGSWKIFSSTAFMSSVNILTTEPIELGDFRLFQPLEIFEFESAEIEAKEDQRGAIIDIRAKEAVPFLRPFFSPWTMAGQFGDEFMAEFNKVKRKDSDRLDQQKFAAFITNTGLQCKWSPITIYPWAFSGITKCSAYNEIGNPESGRTPWYFFWSEFDDKSPYQ